MVFLSKTKLKEEECKKKKILSFQHKDFYPNKTKTFFFSYSYSISWHYIGNFKKYVNTIKKKNRIYFTFNGHAGTYTH